MFGPFSHPLSLSCSVLSIANHCCLYTVLSHSDNDTRGSWVHIRPTNLSLRQQWTICGQADAYCTQNQLNLSQKSLIWLESECTRKVSPGGRMLSRSSMRAEARSLMMYCRRMCLKTGTKGIPSSVFRYGSSSPASVCESVPVRGRLYKCACVFLWVQRTTSSFAQPGICIKQKLFDRPIPGWIKL